MTYQTTRPVRELPISISARSLGEMVHQLQQGDMTCDLPYQRGAVWSTGQRIELIYSVLSATPIPAIIVNKRPHSMWFAEDGKRLPIYAVIDGKQRLTTLQKFMEGRLEVPASWFPAEDVLETYAMDDGPYVSYPMLARRQQRFFENRALPVAEAHVMTVRQEAAIYLRVNGMGTPQAQEDFTRAARVAGAGGEG